MAPVITRLLLTLSLFVAAPLLYTVIIVIAFELMRYRDDTNVFVVANLLVAGFFALAWILIWMHEVRWTPLRIGLTLGAGAASVLVAVVFAVVGSIAAGHDEGLYVFLGGMLWLVLWLFGTSLAWMELPAERRKRYEALGVTNLPCPSCGYNLAGLNQSKCPECGASFTLDSLYAALKEQAEPI